VSTSAARPASRLASIDIVRGLVIVLMALDHTRDFFGPDAHHLDAATTPPALYLTRWVTHLCAPTFVFLAGVGAALSSLPTRALARFLALRGLFLIALELTVIGRSWTFELAWRFQPLQVIWALGVSMVILAGLVFLPKRVVAMLSIVVIAGHNLLDGVRSDGLGWTLLHQERPVELAPGHTLFVAYPILPWAAVMALGWALGDLWKRADRRRLLTIGGVSLLALFALLRLPNLYGDPHPWVAQESAVRTAMAIFRVEKYPPSLAYLCVTLGITLLGLAALDRVRRGGPFETFGRVPLFFYLIHLPAIHGVAVLIRSQLHPERFDLFGVYVAWVACTVGLYFPCVAYARWKARRPDLTILRYL